MTIEEIRKNAPDWATHYIQLKECVLYIKGQCIWNGKAWEYALFDVLDTKPL